MKYNYVIIEDDKASLENLKFALKDKKDYKFKGHASNKNDGIELIISILPDLIFLDVELGEFTGFDILTELRDLCFLIPPVILTTAYDNHGKKAVNNQVTYFLSKPICSYEMTKALKSFEKHYTSLHSQLFIRNGKALELIKYDDIAYLEADAGYTKIILDNGKIISASKSLKHFENILKDNFLRIHRSYIINLKKIKEIKLTERVCILETSCELCKIEIGKNQITPLRSKLKI